MSGYDGLRFNPPAPVAHVRLRNQAQATEVVDVPMLIDTGADVTLLPRKAVESLGVIDQEAQSYQLVGFDGSESLARAVTLEILLDRWTFRGQFLLIDQEWGILGRNILNALSLLLDGPRLAWNVQQQR